MTRPLARQKFHIARGRKLEVLIWPDHRATTRAWKKSDGKVGNRTRLKAGEAVYGFCLYTIKSGNAQIHLSLNTAGAGLWAHELQHLILYELRFRRSFQDEPIARLAEKLTRQFWNWFYERFTEVKPGKKPLAQKINTR